jgi:hypothetical protein
MASYAHVVTAGDAQLAPSVITRLHGSDSTPFDGPNSITKPNASSKHPATNHDGDIFYDVPPEVPFKLVKKFPFGKKNQKGKIPQTPEEKFLSKKPVKQSNQSSMSYTGVAKVAFVKIKSWFSSPAKQVTHSPTAVFGSARMIPNTIHAEIEKPTVATPKKPNVAIPKPTVASIQTKLRFLPSPAQDTESLNKLWQEQSVSVISSDSFLKELISSINKYDSNPFNSEEEKKEQMALILQRVIQTVHTHLFPKWESAFNAVKESAHRICPSPKTNPKKKATRPDKKRRPSHQDEVSWLPHTPPTTSEGAPPTGDDPVSSRTRLQSMPKLPPRMAL